jgi:outer membrane protein OmpA-like peptidoglycan-associated protein
VELSRLRAQAVKDVLVELGAPAERMTVVGLGSDFPGYTQDHDASGQVIPEAAEANRKVFVELAGGGDLDCS